MNRGGRVTVVGLGPAGPDLVTDGARAALDAVAADRRFLRTARHPSAVVAGAAASFDDEYARAERFEDVYAAIVERVVDATRVGDVVYAVPGSPRVAEQTVELLVADDRVPVTTLPALSFADLTWVRLGVDPLTEGVRLVDARRFGIDAAGERGPLLVAQAHSRAVLSDVKLAAEDQPPHAPVVVLHHLGLRDEAIVEVAWADLDRTVEPDHLTSLYVPEMAAPVAGEVQRFDELVWRLRHECPWDREQTHESLRRHLLEETYEVLDAIDRLPDEGSEALEEELGDLLFQVVFHAALARQRGEFTLADVARGIHDKLHSRHPHVFGDAAGAGAVTDPDEVVADWEAIKRAEKGRLSAMDGIVETLPALVRAQKVLRKAAQQGVDLTHGGGSGIGDRLLALVDEARIGDVDAEDALRARTNDAIRAFRAHEEQV